MDGGSSTHIDLLARLLEVGDDLGERIGWKGGAVDVLGVWVGSGDDVGVDCVSELPGGHCHCFLYYSLVSVLYMLVSYIFGWFGIVLWGLCKHRGWWSSCRQ